MVVEELVAVEPGNCGANARDVLTEKIKTRKYRRIETRPARKNIYNFVVISGSKRIAGLELDRENVPAASSAGIW